MKTHLIIVQEPLAWHLAPPLMYGLCSAEVQNPTPVDSFTVDKGMLPEFNTLTTCGKCLAKLAGKPRWHDDAAEEGALAPAPFYVYAIADRDTLQATEVRVDLFAPETFAAADPRPEAKEFLQEAEQHTGETITELENTVTRVGVTKAHP